MVAEREVSEDYSRNRELLLHRISIEYRSEKIGSMTYQMENLEMEKVKANLFLSSSEPLIITHRRRRVTKP